MARTLSFPFRLSATGVPVTVSEDTDEHYVELLTALAMTRPGERQLAPSFGIADPSYEGFSAAALGAAAEMFGPAVDVTEVEIRFLDERTSEVIVGFE